jgi:hypothetical protein
MTIHRFLALLALLIAGVTHAQTALPPSSALTLISDVSREVSIPLMGNDRTWRNYRSVTLTRAPVQDSRAAWVYLLPGGGRVLLNSQTFAQNLVSGSQPDPQRLSESNTRPDQPLAAGMKWSLEQVDEFPPVDWCHDRKGKIISNFEVGQPEDFPLVIDGKPTTVKVLPVVEQGRWERCVSGKRFTRLLVSPEMQTVLSIEHVGFRTNGGVHESSYRFNVKEVKATPSN